MVARPELTFPLRNRKPRPRRIFARPDQLAQRALKAERRHQLVTAVVHLLSARPP